ncbi:MAG: SprB repeat-containing protein, partial [Bacteroidota bacterium]|nr:SprB repeat-containing protein [Bacteroidota bacterium]
LTATGTESNIDCYGNCNGAIDLTVSGGYTPYSFLWSNGETTEDLVNVCAGSYSVLVSEPQTANSQGWPWNYSITSANHTILIHPSTSIIINGSPAPTGSYLGVFYYDNGVLECGGYMYWTGLMNSITAWGDESSTPDKDGFANNESFIWKLWDNGVEYDLIPEYNPTLSAQGNYVNNGMTAVVSLTTPSTVALSFTITQPDSIILNPAITHADSVIGNNGAIDLTISGGVSPYSILWSNGETTEDIDSLVAGTYFLTLTDANSCVEIVSYTINSLSQISLSFGSTAVSATGASDGTAWVIVSGGVSPYQYQWDFSAINNDTIFNLESHYYHVTVTDAVNNQAMGQVYVSGGLLELSIGVNLAGETGASDGLCYAYPYGGTPPFTYIWSTGETTDSISGLPAGTYALTITDNLSIQATSEATIYNLANRIWIEFISAPVTTTLASDGSIDISCSGGIPPYTYSWSTGATTEDLMNLAEGLYQVWVTDNTGITDSSFIYVGSDQALDWSFINTGSSHVVVVYDTIPKSFNWNQVDTGDYIGVFYEDNGSLHCCGYNVYNATTMSIMACGDDYTTGQKDGYYTSDAFIWFIHDASENRDYNVSAMYMETSPYFNHFFINGISVPSRIGDPTPAFDLAVTAIISPQNHCDFNGLFNVSIEISNLGTNTASNFTVSFMMQNGTVLMEMVPMAILPSDTYIHTFFILFDGSVYEFEENLSITAFVMCTNDANPGNDTLTIDYPNTFPYFSLQNDVLGNCIGSISIDSVFNNSGSQPDFFWGNTSYGNNMFIDSLCAGNYTFFINDSICTDSFIFEIEDEPLMIQFNSNPPTCNGMLDGNIDAVLNYAPGTNYSYLWSTGDTTSSISGLGGGMYILTVSQNSTYLISDTVELLDPPLLYFTGSVQNSSAAGLQDGAIDVTVTGGIPPYSYLWSNGATSEDLLNIGMGNFIVSVSDANLCELVDSFSVISLGSTLSFDFSTIAADCYGSATGSAWISNLIGVAPFSFIWSNGATTDSISGLPAGNYSVTVFAGNGDIVSNNIDVLQPDEILVNFVVLPVDPAIGNDGAIDLTPSGGTSPYSFAWSTGATTEDIGNLVYGQYSLTLTDANSCQLTASFMVEYSGIYLSFDMVAQDADCYGASTGSAWISNLIGVAPFNYFWSNGAGTDSIYNLPAGNYSVTVFAGNGDIVSNNIDVLQPDEILVNFVVSMADPILMSDGAIDITVSGGTSPYSYLWSDGSTNEDLSSAPYGSYQLTVSDANLCELSANTFVDFNVLPNWDFNLSGTTHSIDIPATALLQLNGVLLETNDFIGVFYDSLGSLSCGGYIVWQQNSTTLLAYGDNPATTNPDGFANAEEFEWIVWDVSNNMEHFAAASYNSAYPNQQYWQANGQSGLDSLQTVTISGTVSTTTKSNLPLGMIVLYEPIQNSYYAVEKGLVTNGQWEIEGVLPGNYLIYAIPVPGYDYGIPGYFVQ